MRVGSKRLRFKEHGRRRFVLFIIVLCLVAAGIVAVVYAMQQPDGFKSLTSLFQGKPAPTATAAQIDINEFTPTLAPIATQQAAVSVMPASGISPTADAGAGAADGVAFMGNSNLEDLYIYGVLPDADFFYKVGLTVADVYDTPADQGTVPIIEEFQDKDYEKIFLMFGNNELGWDSKSKFLDEYQELIQKLHEEDPNARIYVMGILPVTKTVSDDAVDGVTQERIDEFNEDLKRLASDNDCYFLDLGLAMKGTDGYLPEDAAADGVHLNKDYSVRWAEILRNEIGGEAG